MNRLQLVACAVIALTLCGACDSSDDSPSGGSPLEPNGIGKNGLKLSGIGDSIMQGFNASPCSLPMCLDEPDYSFAQGTEASVNSLFSRFDAPGKEFVSGSGAALISGTNSGVAQAKRLCAQAVRPNRIVILLGANDVCNAASMEELPSSQQFASALTELLATLTSETCALTEGTSVHVMSIPRLDLLRETGLAKTDVNCDSIWKHYGICSLVTNAPTAETLQAVSILVDGYNRVIRQTVLGFNGTRGVEFSTDYVDTTPNTSLGTYPFTTAELSSLDCFHPSAQGQARLACIAWQTWQGDGTLDSCLDD